MGEYGKLASTGVGVSLFGVTLGTGWLIVVAVLLVVIGALVLRVGWRRHKRVGDR